MDTNQVLLKVRLSVLAAKDLSVFASQLKDDANLIASRVQMYSWTQNATCFKYGCNKTQYRFNFSQPIISDSHIDNTGSIFLHKNNVWVNQWNPALSLILQSKYNITFVTLSNNALALIHYITKYITKSDYSQYK